MTESRSVFAALSSEAAAQAGIGSVPAGHPVGAGTRRWRIGDGETEHGTEIHLGGQRQWPRPASRVRLRLAAGRWAVEEEQGGQDQRSDDQCGNNDRARPAADSACFWCWRASGMRTSAGAGEPAGLRRHDATMHSIMLRVKVDRSEALALHDQVAAEFRHAIAAGEASPGERLPPAKDLAAVLGVNANTVLRALRLLRDESLLEFRRGRGVTVAGSPRTGSRDRTDEAAPRVRPLQRVPERGCARDAGRAALTLALT